MAYTPIVISTKVNTKQPGCITIKDVFSKMLHSLKKKNKNKIHIRNQKSTFEERQTINDATCLVQFETYYAGWRRVASSGNILSILCTYKSTHNVPYES